MKIRHLRLPSGTTQGIPVLIDEHWTPEQALAVYELLDDLRAQIWQHYGPQIQKCYREDRVVDGGDRDLDNTGLDEQS